MSLLVNNFSFLVLYENPDYQWKIVKRIANEHRYPKWGSDGDINPFMGFE